jgi:RHS repeat-associated protein
MVNTNGAIVAKYQYDPYGNLLSLSGPLAEANTYRFSSKEWHQNSGLYYYGFRYYSPGLQRWLNRDPIQEDAGTNLFPVVANNLINVFGTPSYSQNQWTIEEVEL